MSGWLVRWCTHCSSPSSGTRCSRSGFKRPEANDTARHSRAYRNWSSTARPRRHQSGSTTTWRSTSPRMCRHRKNHTSARDPRHPVLSNPRPQARCNLRPSFHPMCARTPVMPSWEALTRGLKLDPRRRSTHRFQCRRLLQTSTWLLGTRRTCRNHCGRISNQISCSRTVLPCQYCQTRLRRKEHKVSIRIPWDRCQRTQCRVACQHNSISSKAVKEAGFFNPDCRVFKANPTCGNNPTLMAGGCPTVKVQIAGARDRLKDSQHPQLSTWRIGKSTEDHPQ